MLAERSGELAVLHRWFEESLARRGRVGLVRGPVASGKTRLLYRFSEQVVESGAVYLAAVASHDEQAVPLGVLDQLFRGCEALADAVPHLDWLMMNPTAASADGGKAASADGGKAGAAHTAALQGLVSSVIALTRERPVVIAVDDVEYADPESRYALLYLARRLRRTRALMIFVVRHRAEHLHSPFLTQLMRQHECHQLQLDPLSPERIGDALAPSLGAERAESMAGNYHRITGGNPYLVDSLLEDQLVDGGADPARPTPGGTFDHAVLACLDRAGPEALAVAQGVALLGDAATPDRLRRLLDRTERVVQRGLQDLEAIGLLHDGRFRHRAAWRIVLDDMPADVRTTLHRAAADILYLDGEPAAAVARHLVAAGHIGDAGAGQVLREAARQSLPAEDLPFAAACLELVLRTGDPAERLGVTATLAEVEWRLNPWSAAHRLGPLVAAARDRELDARQMIVLIRSLLWLGRVDEAHEVIARLDGEAATDPELKTELDVVREGMRACYPNPADQPVSPSLAAVLANRADEWTLRHIEAGLRCESLDDTALDQIVAGVLALLYADHADRAATWCDAYLSDPAAERAPVWHARLTAVRAEIALRQGDLPNAERLARAALDRLPVRGWGIAIGAPVATLSRACSLMGRQAEAEEALRLTLPEGLTRTRFWPQYLWARGHQHLAANRVQMALTDFTECGQRLAHLGIDTPGFVMWRTGAAATRLRMGDVAEAHRLVEEQLALAGDGPSRARAISLRLLASTREPRYRPALLRQSVEILQNAGDQLELAGALGDLYQAHRAMGESGRAATVLQRAVRLAREIRAEPLHRALLSEWPEPEGDVLRSAETTGAALRGLSAAERRVISLAAAGLSNREVAGRLFITVSTVEQHLTRAYKKLKVTSRTELAVVWSSSGGGPALSVA
jgi:DNA-binding CsgD family transcriptional regulator